MLGIDVDNVIELSDDQIKQVYTIIRSIVDDKRFPVLMSDYDVEFSLNSTYKNFKDSIKFFMEKGYNHSEIDHLYVNKNFNLSSIDFDFNSTPSLSDNFTVKVYLDSISSIINDILMREHYLKDNDIIVVCDAEIEDIEESALNANIYLNFEIYSV